MHRIRDRFHFTYVVLDLVCLSLIYYLFYLWRYNPNWLQLVFYPAKWNQIYLVAFSEYTGIFVLWAALSILSLNRDKLFSTDRSLTILKESWQVFKSLLFAGIPTMAAIFMLKFEIYSRLVFILSWIGAFLLISFWRILKRMYIRYRINRGLGLIRVLIVGTGSIAEGIINELKNYPYLGFEIAGFLIQEKYVDQNFCGFKVLGHYNDLQNIVQKYYIDEVFISARLPSKQLNEIILIGRKHGFGIKIVPEGFKNIYGDLKTYNLGYIHFLEYGYKKMHGTQLFIKRFFDVILSGLLLVLLSPVFIVFAILVKIDSKGPVFYISKRVGRKKKIFNFYKFRSMVINADKLKDSLRDKSEVDGPIFKIKDDPRITKTGKFMRKWSIDELPQIWNVFIGSMSLVGPRPPTPDEVVKYDIWQMRRLEIKPGITCMWQVRGRSKLGFYKWVKWDLWYIDNWSFWLDIKILLWTLPAVLRKDGAY